MSELTDHLGGVTSIPEVPRITCLRCGADIEAQGYMCCPVESGAP